MTMHHLEGNKKRAQFRARVVALLCVLFSLFAPLTAQGQFLGPMLGPQIEPCDIVDCETGSVMDTGQFFGYVGTLGRVLSTGLGEESLEGDRYWVWAEYLPGNYVAFNYASRTYAPWVDAYADDPETWAKVFVPGPTKELALAKGELADAKVVSAQTLRDLWQVYEELEGDVQGPIPVDDTHLAFVRAGTTHVYEYLDPDHPDGPIAIEFPVNPTDGYAQTVIHNSSYQAVLALKNGSVQFVSEGTIAYLTDYFNRKPEDDDGGARGGCSDRTFEEVAGPLGYPGSPNLAGRFINCDSRKVGELLAPLGAASITAVGYNPATMGPGAGYDWVPVHPNGYYQIYYKYPRNYFSVNPVYVKVPMAPFDDRRSAGVFTDTIKAVYGGASWSSKWDPVGGSIPAVNNVNFPIRTAYLAGKARFVNVDAFDPPAGEDLQFYDPDQVDIAVQHGSSGQTIYDEAPPLQSPTEAREIGSGVYRYDAPAADLRHRGLLKEIAQADLLNTDTYIFASDSEGNVLPNTSDFYLFEKRALFSNELYGFQPDGSGGYIFQPEEDENGKYFARFEPRAFVPHPGSQYFKLYLVNRVTGYMGSAMLKLVNRHGGDSTAETPAEGPTEGMVTLAPFFRDVQGREFAAISGKGGSGWEMPLLPPNIKVTARRANPRALANAEQTIGFEGAGLTDDTIQIEVEWREQDGSPLPKGLPGFSGRLSVVGNDGNPTLHPAANNTQTQDGQAAAHFDITPGRNVELVRVPGLGENQHFYLHVHAVPTERCTSESAARVHPSYGVSAACLNFSSNLKVSSGEQGGALEYRPRNYVPIRVPIYDEMATLAKFQAVANAIRAGAHGDVQTDPSARLLAERVDNGDGTFSQEAIKPVYKYVYRPELQFSLYELPEEEPEATVITDLNALGVSQTGLEFTTTIKGPVADPLASWGVDDRSILWSLGYAEFLALTDGTPHQIGCAPEIVAEGECALDLDRLASLTPADQLGSVTGIAAELTAADFLAIQLYSATDAGNVLYEYDLGHPLVSARSTFLELRRYHDQSKLDSQKWTDSYEVVNFAVNEPVKVTGKVLRPDGSLAGSLPFIQQETLAEEGDYSFVLDYSTIIAFVSDENAAADSKAPNFILQLEFTKIDRPLGENDDSPSHIVRFPGRITYEKVGEPIGQYVQHKVNLNDGSIQYGVTDFSIPGAGPLLDFNRSYSNLNRDGAGVLGPGWDHSLDQRLVPLGTDFIQDGLPVPDWVANSRGKISPAQAVEAQMLAEGGRSLGKVQVNGTVFQFDGTTWNPDPGRFGELTLDSRPCSAVAGPPLAAADDPIEPAADLPGCFVFRARDGTEYFYDEPKMVMANAAPPISDRYLLSLFDRLAYRAGFTDLFIETDPVLTSVGLPASPWQATPVRLVRDSFGEELVFRYDRSQPPDATGKKPAPLLERVIDVAKGGTNRECEFIYDGAPAGCTAFAGRLSQVRCLSSRPIVVNFCYDENGYLKRAERALEWEAYEYLAEAHTDSDDPECTVQTSPDLSGNLAHCPFNLTKISNETGDFTSFEYFTSGEPDLGLEALEERSYGEVVRQVTYAATTLETGDSESTVEFVYDGLQRQMSHLRSELGGAATTLTLNTRGNVQTVEEPVVGGPTNLTRLTTRGWYSEGDHRNGLLEFEEVSDAKLTLRTEYDYDTNGNVTLQETTGTGISGSVAVEMTWTEDAQLLSRTESRRGRTVKAEAWSYDSRGFRTSYTDGNLHTWTYAPHSQHPGLIGKETSPSNPPLVVDYDYDAHGNETSKTIGGDRETKTPRTERGEIDWLEDGRGNRWDYSYNENGRLLSTVLPAGISGTATNPSMTYLDGGRLVHTDTDQNGLTLTYEYNARNQVKSITRSEGGGKKIFYYDGAGSVVAESDWNGNETTYEFDSLGTRWRTTNREDDAWTNNDVDSFGHVWRSTDYADVVTAFTHDALGRELTRTRQGCGSRGDPCGTVRSVYDQAPQGIGAYSVAVTGEDGVVTNTTFDANGLILSVQRGSAVTTTEYNENGSPTKVVDAAGFCTWHRYDKYGDRVATLEDGDDCDGRGYLTRFSYNENGQIASTSKWPDSEGGESLTSSPAGRVAVTTYDYDGLGRMKSETPPETADPLANGEPSTFEYNGEGAITRITDNRGAVRTWQRNTLGWVTIFRDAALNAGGPGGNECGGTACYQDFDHNGNPRTIIGARGTSTTIEYDREDRPTVLTEGANVAEVRRVTAFRSYDGMGNPTEVEQGGVTTLMTYNGRHDLYTQTVVGVSSDGNDLPDLVRTLQYTESGLLRTETTTDGTDTYVRTNVYDSNNFIRETYYPDDCGGSPNPSSCTLEGSQTNDAAGNVLTQTSQSGALTVNNLDEFHRVDTVTLSGPDQAAVQVSDTDYDGLGNPKRMVDANGNVTTFAYDIRGRLTHTVLPQLDEDSETEAERTEERRYDPVGNVREILAPSRTTETVLVTAFEYDAENRKTLERVAGETTTWTYDEAGNLVSETLPAQQGMAIGEPTRSTTMHHDALDRLKWVRDRLGNVTSYDYDDRDNQIKYTFSPAVGPTVSAESTYDSRNNVERITQLSADGDIVTRYSGYDVLNNPRFLHDAMGRTLEYDYDHRGRRVAATYPSTGAQLGEARSISWAYEDAQARVTITETKTGSATASDVSVLNHSRTWGYPTSVSQRGHEITYGYDLNGNRLSVESQNADTFYAYDSRNRLKSVEVEFAGITEYSYYPDGRPDNIYFPNGVVTTATYWPSRRVQTITHTGSTDGNVSVGYRYDPNGNREWQGEVRPEGSEETEYGFDALDRLAHYTMGANSSQWERTTYQFEGYNRTRETVVETIGGSSTTLKSRDLSYDDLNRLTRIDEHEEEGGYAIDYTYDANGNTTGKIKSTEPENALEFRYDSRDQLTQIARGPPGAQVIVGQYDYNHAGQRVRSRTDVSGRESVDYLHDDSSVLEELDGDDEAPLARYHYGANSAVALQKMSGSDAGVRFYHTDAAGTPTHLTNEDGSIAQSYKVDPWGRPRAGTDVDADYNRKLFTGHEYDTESELYYAQARYYDPDSGRFLTQDSYLGSPDNPPSLHRYLYAYSNPAVYADPSGHWPEFLDEWARNTDIMANPVFRNLADRGEALVSAPGVLIDKAKEAGKRIEEAYDNGGVLEAAKQTGGEAWGATKAVAGAFGDTIKTTGEALGDIAYNCTPGDGKCDAEMASKAVDAILGAADIVTTVAGGGAAVAKAATTTSKAVAAVKQTAQTASKLGVKGSVKAGTQAIKTAAKSGAHKTAEALSGARKVTVEAVSKVARGAENLPSNIRRSAQAARATAQLSLTRAAGTVRAAFGKVKDAVSSAKSTISQAMTRGKGLRDVPCSMAAGTMILGGTGDFFHVIDDVEVGDRVFVADGADSPEARPRDYRLIVARYVAPDGDVFEMQVLRPNAWAEEMRVETRTRLPMAAFGFDHVGSAEILGVRDAPVFEEGPGRLVLSKFSHVALDTIEVTFSGEEQTPLVVTPVHEFWNPAFREWVPASRLSVGDEVQTKTGISHIVGIESRAGPQQVFDIEVEKEHLYYAGDGQVMVHNCTKSGPLMADGSFFSKQLDGASGGAGGTRFGGGAHREMKGPRGDGLDSHHMPDRGADPRFSAEDGPAIRMDPADHHATSSNGRRGLEAAAYRQETADLISVGRYRDAMAREIRDVRRAAREVSGDARKYNTSIQEMLDYAKRSGQLPPAPKRAK